MSTVKICGLQQTEMVRAVLHLPIDHIGFVFAPSKRQVTPERAREMIRVLVERREAGMPVPLTVGVFVNPTQCDLTEVMEKAPLDVIQLHGQESPEQCRWVKDAFPAVRVWKVVSVAQLQVESDRRTPGERSHTVSGAAEVSSVATCATADVAAAVLEPYRHAVDGIVLDTFDPVYGGGSGKTFAWDAIPPYQEWCRANGIELLVAGGLQAGNVGALLDAYAPDGVDVSSGVETDGVKDLNKIISFVERVKQHVQCTG
ncbi:phosphoribosylanthranilate isomerase [Paenibacillus xerothermodurans]|uniref:N-(5'-phosphoribosyl)anthranilate isomerase n=1 Tax=Paenibacillus xerothermodurans TaxID=1977292 RepID=A0A2W1NB62_PAEXE|nr:phosphoribosylanthranilate isomerase [Paenibacillus xerothermodurans]PZE21939.1 phosphoribosylanthranilate isomerase [Paenibacillus xerothermodurans]